MRALAHKENQALVEISENILCGGNADFIRKVGIPVNEAVSVIAKEYPVSEERAIELDTRPQGHLSELAGIIGICSFVGSWFATKALDEVYAHKISPLIKRLLRNYIREPSGRMYGLTISCFNREKDVHLLIACVGSTVDEIESAEKNIGKVFGMLQASDIEAQDGDVLLAVIEAGSLNLEIQRHPNYTTTLDALKSMYPAKVPSFLDEKR